MKKLLLTLLTVMMMPCVMAQDGKFTLTGKVKGLGPMAFYVVTDVWGEAPDEGKVVPIIDGKVDYSCDINEVGWMMVLSGGRMYMLPAIPGETVTINGDIDDYTIDGSQPYKEYNEFQAAVKPLLAVKDEYDFKQACRDEIAGMTSEQVFDLYQLKMRENSRPVADAVLDFVGKHSDRESSLMVLNYLNFADDMEKARGLISEQVLDGRMKPYYEGPLDRITRVGASNPLIGKPAPEINLKDVGGKELSLSSLRGKWVLLNFWSADCGNAVIKFPALKELYAKYKDHVEFLGVDCEDDEEDWKAAVSTYGLPWPNVLGSFDAPDSPVVLYQETATPAYFLIAPSGKMAMRGSMEEFMNIFDILFE